MSVELQEETAFLSARRSISRSALTRFKHSQNATDDAAVLAAEAAFFTLPILHDPNLLALSHRALGAARGRRVGGSTPFPSTLWFGGAEKTWDGRDFLGTIEQFVRLLEERAKALAPKKTGWVIEPTTNTDGWRGNSSTVAMHALFLDCDGTGSWDTLLHTLTTLDYCFVAYQSGGWTHATPKWRVVLPLHTSHDTSTEAGQNAWKTLYNNCRCVFGAVARLYNVGFDPATETPCSPWFLTEKREAGDPERQVVWREGHSLDLTALTIALPEVVEERVEPSVNSVAAELTLDEERMNHIIDVLSAATNRVPSGRRDLYLALPGALLDRGIQPDDVFAIIEAVSASYPRAHPEKHADNLHNARTTIAKREAKENYTRIGTLNTVAPGVAAALDSVLPDLAARAIVDAMEKMLGLPTTPTVQVGATPSSPSSFPPVVSKRKGNLSEIGRKVSPLVTRLKSSKKDIKRLSGILLGCFRDGVPIPTTAATSTADVDEMVCTAMRTLGRLLPAATRWQEVLDFASTSLHAIDFTQSVARVAVAERAFYEGQGKRNVSNMKKAAECAAQRASADSFFAEAAKRKGHGNV